MALRWLPAILAAALTAPLAAQAASFNCMNASSPMETTICENPSLSRQDDLMASLYLHDIGQLSPTDRTLFRRDQLDWLRIHQKDYPTSDNYRDTFAENLAAAYDQRIAYLKAAVFHAGPYLFADVGQMCLASSYDTTSTPGRNSIATHAWSYPRIDDPTTKLALAWNDFTSTHADKQTCDSAVSDSGESYQVHLATDRVISAVRNDSSFGHGAAHGGNDSVAMNLMGAENPHPLTPSDLFQTDKPWRTVLAALILAAMPEEVPGSKASDPAFEKTANVIAGDPARWILDPQGLTIQFQDYEIGSYSFGEPTITIPWYSLRAVMVSTPPVP